MKMIVPAVGTSRNWDGSIILGSTCSKTKVVIDIAELILAGSYNRRPLAPSSCLGINSAYAYVSRDGCSPRPAGCHVAHGPDKTTS